ncbi:MAG: hypothetical protein L6Q29_03620 [Candidatus Pacebacteria bacterium]|nr:hypothetical protein [Candidatus Paceibacterota bacterium]
MGIAKATDQYSTTTLIGTSYEVAANKQATIVASSTPLGNTLFSPNDWLVFKMGGGSGGNFSPTGVCQATWEVI